MIEICLVRRGKTFVPFSEHDYEESLTFQENQPLTAKLTGSKKLPKYVQLCCYMGSCGYIASLAFNESMSTKEGVDLLTRVKLGFIKHRLVADDGGVHFIPKSLSYRNCHQKDRTAFISAALEDHAALVGLGVHDYLKLLNSQG